MTEETIFAEALEKSTPIDRTAYLDKACAGDTVLRQRIETLLKSHEADGDFLGTPAIQCAAEELAVHMCAGDTQGEQHVDDGGVEALDFLAPSDKPGALGRLGHYEILEVIGRGGMGIVLRALDEKLHRVVAIKVMAAQLATNATARKRFTREAQAAAAVTHDHIVTIHAVEEANGLPYLVMQFVSGMSLQQRLDRSGPLELREIVRIGMQTAAGLAAAHAHGLIHRDIKLANILLENGVERVKITDFGLARAVADASLTQSGVVAGTPQYMSPEQARGETVDQRTDLFSLGSVLYSMCTGRPPFRANSGMAVLKRVCEEAPSAICETNPEIPDWMVAIVNKLHAKNPAERFQSAAEVAGLLKDHLAHLQHPSVVGPVAGNLASPAWRAEPRKGPGSEGEAAVCQPAPRRRRRWAMAAAVLLLCVAAGLGFTEATSVTNLRATVMRIFTPDGTLIVEVDDPDVKVTIEGDGGIVITGAGLQEVRLKPGSYKVRAAKDGKAVRLDQELVTITRGDKQVVRVRLEAEAPLAPPVAKADKGAFVLLAAGKERMFDTLPEAVQGASDGDTIEIRGNGPFVSPPVNLGNQALTIRAGEAFRPVIQLSPEGVQRKQCLLTTTAPLVLEGLELHPSGVGVGVLETQAPLWAANCRFGNGVNIHSPLCVFRNCESRYAGGFLRPGARWTFENCLLRSKETALMPHYNDASVHDVCIRIKRSTVVSSGPAINLCLDVPLPVPPDARQAAQPIRLDVSGSVFGGPNVLGFELVPQKSLDKAAAPQPAEAEATLLRLLKWQGKRDIFAAGSTSVWANQLGQRLPPGPKGLEAWKRFWGGAEADSLEGVLRFQGGNLLPRVGAEGVDLDQLTPGDFRLRPDSAGYRAGKDGKDLGADVDLVGPGPAYERWKKTPEYQQWLKDLKAANAEAAKPVLLMHFDKADFYEKDGKTYVRDRSGKGNDGLCEQVEFTPEGKTGGGLANAGKGFLRLPTSLVAGRSHFTITAWVKRTNLANPWAVYSCHQKVYPASDMPRFNFFCTNHLYVGAWNGASDWVHATALDADISPGEWVFVAVSLENGAPGKGRLQLMLNDRFAEKSLQQVGGEPLETTQDIAALKLEGVFDELTVWHRALTEQELREVFALHQPVSKK